MRSSPAPKLLPLVLIACASCPSFGDEDFRQRPEWHVLVRAEGFYTSHYGEGGDTPPFVVAWQMLFERPDAKLAFRALLKEGRLGGKLYALAGLWLKDPEAFRRALPAFVGDETKVGVASGCCFSDVPAKSLVQRADAIRLQGPQDSLEAALARAGKKHGRLDLVGGGFSDRLRTFNGRGSEDALEDLDPQQRRPEFWIQALLKSCASERGPLGTEEGGEELYEILFTIRRFGARAVPLVLPLLRSPNPRVRLWGVVLASRMDPAALGRAAAPLVAPLGLLLADPEPAIQIEAAYALECHGSWAGAALPSVRAALLRLPPDLGVEDDDEAEEDEAEEDEEQPADPSDEDEGDLASLQAEEDLERAERRMRYLLNVVQLVDPPARSDLLALLIHENPAIVAEAIEALSTRAFEHALAPRDLLGWARDERKQVREAAFAALYEQAAALPASSFFALEAMTSSDDASAASSALEVLAAAGPRAKRAIPALRLALGSPHAEVREAAAIALWRVDRQTSGIEVLAASAATLTPSGRRFPSGPALDTLALMVRDPSARREFMTLAASASVPAPSAQVLLSSIAGVGSVAREHGPALAALAQTAGPKALPAAEAYFRVTGEVSLALAFHRERLLSSDLEQVRASAKALASFGAPAGPALPDLLRAFDRAPESLALPLSRLAGALGPAGALATKTLVRCASFNDGRVRRAACRALGAIGALAAEALPRLRRLAEFESDYDSPAQDAIQAIEADLKSRAEEEGAEAPAKR